MDLRRFVAIARSRFLLVCALVLLAAGSAFVVSTLQAKVYEGKATLVVGQSLSVVNPDYTQLLVSQRLSATYAAVATKRPTVEAVIRQLGLEETYEELSRRVRADAPAESTLLTVIAQDEDPVRAADIANALAEQLMATSPSIQGRQAEFQAAIDTQLEATQEQITMAQAQLEELAVIADRTDEEDTLLRSVEDRLAMLRSTYATLLSFSSGSASNQLSIIEPAVPPSGPVSPRPTLNTLIAALIGLLVAAAVVYVLEYVDDTVKTDEDVRALLGLSTLGSIERMKAGDARGEIYRLATILHPRSGAAETFRTLRTNVEFTAVDSPLRTLLVTSPGPEEGKTVTAANLAVAFAQAGRRVLLVDADLRKPGVHVIFDLPNQHGLTTLLRGEEVSLDAVAQSTEQANLRVLTTGPLPPNPAELLGSKRMQVLHADIRAGADITIFDSPPLQAVTDSTVLSSFVDGTLLVLDAGRSRRRAVLQSRDALARAGANVLGVVLNRVPARAHGRYSEYYGSYRASDQGLEGHSPIPADSRGQGASS